MKKIDMKVLFCLLLLLPFAGPHLMVNGIIDGSPNWRVAPGDQMVYTISDLSYNNTNSWPITTYDEVTMQDRQIGNLEINDLFFVRVWNLPDLTNPDDVEVTLELDASGTQEGWEHRYQYNYTYGWPEKFDGPPFFMPVMTVPTDLAFWGVRATNWNNAEGGGVFTSSYDSVNQVFSLSGGANTTLNVTDFSITWDAETGHMLSYNATGTDGNTNTPYLLTIDFLYFRDETEWDLHWGINTGEMFAFRFTTIDWAGNNSIDFGDSTDKPQNYEKKYIYQGDLLLFNLYYLSDLLTDGPPHWNATATSPNWEMDFYYEFRDIGANDGPQTWYPIMPLGNDNFYANITDDFAAIGGTLTKTAELNITIDDGTMRESARWDLSSGLLQQLIFDGDVSEGHIYLVLDFMYHFAPGGEPVFASNDMEARYIINDVTNGTQNYLDFGEVGDYVDEYGNPYGKPFKLYENDIFRVSQHIETYWNGAYEEQRPRWYGRTSSGYEVESWAVYEQPGFEMLADGPPALMFVIPIGTQTKSGATWWNTLETVYNGLGYTVVNTANEFGISATTDFDYAGRWDKTTGIMNYYYIHKDASADNPEITWEMTRSQYIISGPTGLSWGINIGTSMEYTFSGITTPIPFGENEAGEINNGDVMTVLFNELGDFEQQGPYVNVDMTVGSVTQANVSMGLKDPGFEFVSFENDNQGDGGPPLLYFAIPVGDASFYDTIVGMYTDAGYTSSYNSTHFWVSIVNPMIAGDTMSLSVDAVWEKATGLLVYYHLDGIFDGTSLVFTAVLGTADIVTPSNTPDNNKPGLNLPLSGTTFLAIPFVWIVAIVRRRKYSSKH